jgi:phospholipid/cholesterol/gamma-HCH transport system permease protein
VTSWQIERRDDRIELGGTLRLADAAPIWRQLARLAAKPGRHLDLDLRRAELVDGAVMALLVDVRAQLLAVGATSEIVNAPAHIAPLVELYRGAEPPPPVVEPPHRSPIAQVGELAERATRRARELVTFAGELVASLVGDLRHVHWRSLPGLAERAGTDGIPIVALLDFLVGFVIAYQSMRQLKTYGANIYIADLVGVSVTRELAPLMTAIIVAGRSGAAFAAEIGTMRVSEEIDALRTMGFSPTSYLAVPRILALALVAPVLTLVGDVVGVTGGLVVGVTSLGLTAHGYMAELRDIVVFSDVWTGLVKSVAFGIAIAFIGCRHGLSARGAASGVGRSTTATVVSCLFAIVVIDTLFTVIFRELAV